VPTGSTRSTMKSGDVIANTKGSKPLGIQPESIARVARVDAESNTLTITRKSGEELKLRPAPLQA